MLTNHHVIQRASTLQIRLADGTGLTARLVAADPANDLALLQLEGDLAKVDLKAIDLARPGDLLLGETVIAVGNPFGLENSVTTGVLSAKNRTLREGEVSFDDILQIDAAINPGNSGGPLINLDGHLIGINLAIRRDAEGIGFAIPLQRIEEIIVHWLVPASFSDSRCGFYPHTVIGSDNSRQIQVADVVPDSPAARAGLAPGAGILEINGQAVTSAITVSRILWRLRAGDRVELKLADGQLVTVPVEKMNDQHLIRHRLGGELQPLTGTLKKALNLPNSINGLTLSNVLPKGALTTARVERGDILYQVNEQPVNDLPDLARLLRGTTAGTPLDLYFNLVKSFRGELFLKQHVIRIIVH